MTNGKSLLDWLRKRKGEQASPIPLLPLSHYPDQLCRRGVAVGNRWQDWFQWPLYRFFHLWVTLIAARV